MATKKWTIDPSHSEIQFKVKHLMITNVTGSFNDFSGSLEGSNEDFTDATILFEAKVDSIDTGNEQRDGHLKSADFFNAAEFPVLTFESSSFEKKADSDYILTGALSLHGVTKTVQLNVEFGGIVTDPYGQIKVGFEINGKINRKDFGLTWGAVTEAGSVVVSEEVKLHFGVQLVQQA
ncbi:MAG: YceI family protein [Ferruginibacter sp.]